MKNDIAIIKALLNIIDRYDDNDIAKDIIISTYREFDYNIIIRLTTKGDTNKNTPFYFGNMYTCITKEYWFNDEVVNADILYSLSPRSPIEGS